MWSRKAALASSLPIDLWPTVNEEELNGERREKYRAQAEAMRLYFANEPVRDIAGRTGVSRTALGRLAKKCLLLSSDGRIFGFRALLPYFRVKSYQRTAKEGPRFVEQKPGHVGALVACLARFPHIEDELVKYIRQDAKAKRISEYKLRPRDLHRLFIKFLRMSEVKDNEWPFNTKYRGIRSIEKYMSGLLDMNFARSVITREEKDAKAHINVGTGHEPFLVYEEPYDAVEIDAYNIECHLSVAVRTPEGTETDLLLERLWLIAAIDRFSTAVLAYVVVYRSEITANDVLRVIRDAATKKWVPMALKFPGLSYPSNAGLPSGVIPEAHGAMWSATLLDGALAHLSKAVHERARKTLGFVINWGAVGHFERRPNVERTFNQIAKDLFKRLPSTTGSHPYSGRAPNAEEKAVRHKIRADDIEQLLDVAIAQHNATPSEGISYLSPLEVLRYFLNDAAQNFLVRRLPAGEFEIAKTFACKQEVVVRGGRSTGRRPYVQIDRVHYTSPVLANAGHLVGQALIVEIEEEDMRLVRAYLKNGAELGYLKAQGRWSFTKHSRRTRTAINSLASRRVITISEFDDPVQVYLSHLSTPSALKKTSTQLLPPRQVTDATRVVKEAEEIPQIVAQSPEKLTTPTQLVRAAEAHRRGSLLNSPTQLFAKVKNRR